MLGSASDFVFESREREVGIKSVLLEYAALNRGFQVERFDERTVLVEAPHTHPLAFRNINGPLSSSTGRFLCDRKDHTRRLVGGAGVSVVPSRLFERGKRRAAWRYAQSLGLPVVLKPPGMARGRGITTAIETWEEFAEAWKKVMHAYRRPDVAQFIVEKHVYGEDYRAFVVDGAVVSVTHRKRASVTGDGMSTVAELIDRKNLTRLDNPYLSEHMIPTDPGDLDRLEFSGHSVDSTPDDGEQVVLRGASNLSAGGDSIDVTDQMHHSFKEIARTAVDSIPGMEYAGVDIIASSINQTATPGTYVVSEVEFSPAPLADFPMEGAPRDMAGDVLGFYLQRYRRRRRPSLRSRARPAR